jgi:lysyl-tRNA synthetase class 2
VGLGVVNNAERILSALDTELNKSVELTLYGRAAFVLGYKDAPEEFARSRDIDAILWIGQADELSRTTNFWEAVEAVNREFRDQELYISHLFEEDQVIVTSKWRDQRVRINQTWNKLEVYRLGDVDLFLSKLMRNDPQDIADAQFVADRAGWSQKIIARIIGSARVPDIPEIREQFFICAAHFLRQTRPAKQRVRLSSAAIAAVSYDEEKRTLDVEFRDGETYRYMHVPEFVYRELLKAESAGVFWNAIKDQFDFEKLRVSGF